MAIAERKSAAQTYAEDMTRSSTTRARLVVLPVASSRESWATVHMATIRTNDGA